MERSAGGHVDCFPVGRKFEYGRTGLFDGAEDKPAVHDKGGQKTEVLAHHFESFFLRLAMVQRGLSFLQIVG